jgi:predicted nuclease of predicted toxin-antitoxin system
VTIWVDEQISPAVASWIASELGTPALPVRDLGLARASDLEIFRAAREANAIIITKDQDFVRLVGRLGPPPSVIWVTCGNTSSARLRDVLRASLASALNLIQAGEALIEISDAR